MCWGLGWNGTPFTAGSGGPRCLQRNSSQVRADVSRCFSPFVIASPWFSCANKAEREGEDCSLLPSFSKSGGGPGGGGGGGGGGRPGPGERADNMVAAEATGPCGREKMESTVLKLMSLPSTGILLMSLTTNVANEELGCKTHKGHPRGTLVHHGSVWDDLRPRQGSP